MSAHGGPFSSPAGAGAMALIPEQLAHYVHAVSGRELVMLGEIPAWRTGRHAVLTAYPLYSPGPDEEFEWERAALEPPAESVPPSFSRLADSLSEALSRLEPGGRDYGIDSLSVLAPFRPKEAPKEARSLRDTYWRLPLPLPEPRGKLRNMLARAGRELELHPEAFNGEHQALIDEYPRFRPLAQGTRSLFAAVEKYAARPERDFTRGRNPTLEPDSDWPPVTLLAARRLAAAGKTRGSLAAFCIGDFSGLHTAFYMFAFREPSAPPGTADLLLSGLVRHATSLGHIRMNLGLGINPKVAFFKQKWGARAFLPYVETSWKLSEQPRSGAFAALRSFFQNILRPHSFRRPARIFRISDG